ncbi:hypothetical protein PpBr36_04824 [Pyricularia pennisetigena]|uniref:hypothetical protein n=1 Tax=Pyricularia pennisetigena TaxID=1578925 RepID=UPI00114F0880|nr:hypothetical protein PpBr36_04824 [Pyricularia pennisetigena]TLS26759.1 hypothetical protein PpBr36_04824 [Pyricularia pennisetigena]
MVIKYGHMFRDRKGDDYLFINNLAQGSFQLAQRVLHLRTGRVVVRKMCISGRYKDNNENWDAGLAAQLKRTEWASIEGVEPPRFARLISARPSAVDSFWELYNCGSIVDIEEMCVMQRVLMSPGFLMRYVGQVLSSLVHLYSMPFDVVHNDLDFRNVWVHLPAQGPPDFYIGDFGEALIDLKPGNGNHCADIRRFNSFFATLDQDRTLRGSPSSTDRWNLLALKEIVNKLHEQCVSEIPFEAGTVKDLIPFLKTAIASVSQLEAAHSSAGKPVLEPEFGRLLKQRTQAVIPPKNGYWQGQPLLHGTMQEIKMASGIRGPWYMAEVDPWSQHVSNIGRDTRG